MFFSPLHQRQVDLRIQFLRKLCISSIDLNEFVGVNLNKNALRIDISEEFNDESVITVPKTLKQMFTIVPSKLRLVTLIAFLLKIFNNYVSYST